MKTKTCLIYSRRWVISIASATALIALLAQAESARSCGPDSLESSLRKLAMNAVSGDPGQSAQAIAELRAKGQRGLDALFSAHADAIRGRQSMAAAPNSDDSNWERLSRALDAVGQQRDCYASHLFWYTDFEQAKAAAKAGGKPILSLRLLGRLDEELSCANSRFFRTALYANAGVSQALRERFVLHWQSVRPVPRITIDFGDGRKLERTITGNSIHYVLDGEGRPIDAIPGLYGPKAFLRALATAETAAKQVANWPTAGREDFLREYHRARLAATEAEWNNDLVRIGNNSMAAVKVPGQSALVTNAAPTAAVATKTTIEKGALEMPVIKSMAPRAPMNAKSLEAKMDEITWTKLATVHAEEARLDQSSRELMRRKAPDAFAAGRLAITKVKVEDPLLRAARQFERSMAEDTIRNEYLFHTKIDAWFAEAIPQTREVDILNDKIYAELFLTPRSDPWLGLKPNDVYSAIEGDGIVASKRN